VVFKESLKAPTDVGLDLGFYLPPISDDFPMILTIIYASSILRSAISSQKNQQAKTIHFPAESRGQLRIKILLLRMFAKANFWPVQWFNP
jgi:hypothetical protein